MNKKELRLTTFLAVSQILILVGLFIISARSAHAATLDTDPIHVGDFVHVTWDDGECTSNMYVGMNGDNTDTSYLCSDGFTVPEEGTHYATSDNDVQLSFDVLASEEVVPPPGESNPDIQPSPVVWTMSAMSIMMLVTIVYFLVFFMIIGVAAWFIIIFFSPIIAILRYGK